MESLIQQEIIRAVINARKQKKDIKRTVKGLAKEFGITEHVVKAVVEMDATYGLEKVGSEKTEGRLWQRMDYTKAIKRLEDKIYKLQAELVRTNNRITRELRLTENPWTERRLASFEAEEEPSEPQEHEEIPSRRYDDSERIRKIGEIIDRAKAKGKIGRTHEVIEPEKRERIEELRGKIDKARSRLNRRGEEGPRLTFRAIEERKD